MNGKVKFYNRTKGFGFVAGEDGTEYFMHKTAIKDGYVPDEDDQVTFEAGESDKGPRASEVKKKEEEVEGLAALDEAA